MPQIEILVQEVSLESITFIREDGLKKLPLMMSMFFTTNTEKPKVSKKTNQEESCEYKGNDLYSTYHLNQYEPFSRFYLIQKYIIKYLLIKV